MGEKKETTMSEPVKNPVLSSLLKKYNETPAENREEKNNRINDVAAEFVENARLLLPVQIDEKFIEKTGPNAAVIKKDGRFDVTVLTAGDGAAEYRCRRGDQSLLRQSRLQQGNPAALP